jgi:hypothetical protein
MLLLGLQSGTFTLSQKSRHNFRCGGTEGQILISKWFCRLLMNERVLTL